MSLLERIDTVCLSVSNIEKAKLWYKEKLGFGVAFQENNYAILSLGDTSIPLTIEEGEVTPHNSIYPIFYTSNIEEAHISLSEKDVKLTKIAREGTNTFFNIFDLDGNKMQVCYC